VGPDAFAFGMTYHMLFPDFIPAGSSLYSYFDGLYEYHSEHEAAGPDPYFFLSLRWDLMSKGVTEVQLNDWLLVSGFLEGRVYPSIKDLFNVTFFRKTGPKLMLKIC
jgi:hypothetical protein